MQTNSTGSAECGDEPGASGQDDAERLHRLQLAAGEGDLDLHGERNGPRQSAHLAIGDRARGGPERVVEEPPVDGLGARAQPIGQGVEQLATAAAAGGAEPELVGDLRLPGKEQSPPPRRR